MTDSIDVVKNYYPDYWEEKPGQHCWPTVSEIGRRDGGPITLSGMFRSCCLLVVKELQRYFIRLRFDVL